MASMLDKSLDDIIAERSKEKKQNRGGGNSGRGGRGRNTNRGGGNFGEGKRGGRGGRSLDRDSRTNFVRNKPIAKPARPTQNTRQYNQRNLKMTVENDMWQHDMYEVNTSRAPAPRGNIETGTKLVISNLHFNVSDEDVKELFEELGDVKRSKVLFDRSGRSEGTAEVVYTRKADAMAAMKRYNGVRLDGQPMHIELAKAGDGGDGGLFSRAGRGGGRSSNSGYGNFSRQQQSGRSGRGGRGGRGGGRGRGQSMRSMEELDADLDSYQGMEE